MTRDASCTERQPLLSSPDRFHDETPRWSAQQQESRLQAFIERSNLSSDIDIFRQAINSFAIGHEIQPAPISKWSQPTTLYLSIFCTALGAIGQGWAQTSMNGANLTFPAALGLASGTDHDNLVVGLINSAIYLSNGIVGAWLATPLNDILGRNHTVFCAATVSLASNVGAALAPTWPILLSARLVLGCALGIISTTLNIYTAECAPAAIRGGLAVSWQFSCAFGIFLGFVANVVLYGAGSISWRLQLAASGISMIPLLPLILWVPPSPAWLIKHGDHYNLAYASLCRLRNTKLEAAREIYQTFQAQQRHDDDGNQAITDSCKESPTALTKLAELVTVPRIRHATFAAHTVMIAQQLCGINIISFYSTTIFTSASFTPLAALLASCVFGLLNFVFAIPAIWTMDTLGRRSLLLYTTPLMALSMFIAGMSFAIPETLDSSLRSSTALSPRFALLASMIYLFCIVYSPGMGPVPAAYSAEVFPLSHREVGMSSAVSSTNIWAAALSASFPWLQSVMGSQGVFTLYSALNVVAWGLVFVFVRETRLKTLEELDGVFDDGVGRFVSEKMGEIRRWMKRPWRVR